VCEVAQEKEKVVKQRQLLCLARHAYCYSASRKLRPSSRSQARCRFTRQLETQCAESQGFFLRHNHQDSMSSKCAAPTLHILRGSLKSYPANGHVAFVPQIRKLVFEYCDYWPSSAHTRTFLRQRVEQLARDNSHVEIVVKQRKHKQPIVRGFYS
jgi:Mitochondrial ribosomal protein L51 / S25 / CI-B8 domain